jgi:hypothetical protein
MTGGAGVPRVGPAPAARRPLTRRTGPEAPGHAPATEARWLLAGHVQLPASAHRSWMRTAAAPEKRTHTRVSSTSGLGVSTADVASIRPAGLRRAPIAVKTMGALMSARSNRAEVRPQRKIATAMTTSAHVHREPPAAGLPAGVPGRGGRQPGPSRQRWPAAPVSAAAGPPAARVAASPSLRSPAPAPPPCPGPGPVPHPARVSHAPRRVAGTGGLGPTGALRRS